MSRSSMLSGVSRPFLFVDAMDGFLGWRVAALAC